LLWTARGGSTWALIVVACLPCYPGNTLLSAPRAARKGWIGAIQNYSPNWFICIYYFNFYLFFLLHFTIYAVILFFLSNWSFMHYLTTHFTHTSFRHKILVIRT
jgi:hypothetical protein